MKQEISISKFQEAKVKELAGIIWNNNSLTLDMIKLLIVVLREKIEKDKPIEDYAKKKDTEEIGAI